MQEPLETMIEKAKIPGVSVAVTSENGDTVTHAAGVTNNDAPQPVTDTTVFEAASLSKPVFAYLIIKMAERHEIDLDKALHLYAPKFGEPELRSSENSENYEKLTARRILSHQAGLPNEFAPDHGFPVAYVSPVGERFDYSGAAFLMLQEVVERIVSPKKLEDLAKEEFGKIGMTHSSFLPKTGCRLIKLPDNEVPTPERLKFLLETDEGIICAGDKLFVAERTEGGLLITEKIQGDSPEEYAQFQAMKKSINSLPGTSFSRHAEAYELPIVTSIIGHRPQKCVESMAVGHQATGEVNPNQRCYGVHPAGSLYTTASDYGKFLRACTTDKYVNSVMFESEVPTLAEKDTKAINAGVPSEVLGQIAWGVGIGIQQTPDGHRVAFHWGDNHTGRNFAAINLDTNKSVACLTNSANGPLVFKRIVEPVVGPIAPITQWLSRREGLNFNSTAQYRDAVDNLNSTKPVSTTTIDVSVDQDQKTI